MLPALTFDDVLRRAPGWGTSEDPTGERLISIVFARPSSPIWRDLETNRAFLDQRSGEAWDLFFAGMSAFGTSEPGAVKLQDPHWCRDYQRFMNPQAFQDLEEAIYRGQNRAAATADRPFELWRYSGETDLVSFMCYARTPDWLSLRSIRIEESMTGRPMSLGRITEGLVRWKDEGVDEGIASGISHAATEVTYATSLGKALEWTAAAVSGGVLGNSAYELLRMLLGR